MDHDAANNLALKADEVNERHKVRDRKRKDDVKNAMVKDLEDLLIRFWNW